MDRWTNDATIENVLAYFLANKFQAPIKYAPSLFILAAHLISQLSFNYRCLTADFWSELNSFSLLDIFFCHFFFLLIDVVGCRFSLADWIWFFSFEIYDSVSARAQITDNDNGEHLSLFNQMSPARNRYSYCLNSFVCMSRHALQILVVPGNLFIV